MVKIKKFPTEAETFKWLVDNQILLKAQRRSENKTSDGLGFQLISYAVNEKGERIKAESDVNPVEDTGTIRVKLIINATNILDSHRDVHQKGLWKKSLKEKLMLYLCQEHDLSFKGIISDEVKAYTQIFTFKELGAPYEGDTECLVFDVIIHEERNSFMYKQYKKGYVRNHSVRMQYVKEYFCLDSNDPDHAQFKENYDKYSETVANKEALETCKWFYAVLEAKVRDEGSAVVKGSCFVTPTLEMEQVKNKLFQAEKSLEEEIPEPPVDTPKTEVQKYIYHS